MFWSNLLFFRGEIPETSGFIIGIKLDEFDEEKPKQRVRTFQLQRHWLFQEIIEIVQAVGKIGFDFIELTGKTYEPFRIERSMKRNVAECAGVIKLHVERAAVYLGGGFRTVPAMVNSFFNLLSFIRYLPSRTREPTVSLWLAQLR